MVMARPWLVGVSFMSIGVLPINSLQE
jgi:hypothetical protein